MPPSAHWQQRVDDALRVELGRIVERTDAPWLHSSAPTRPGTPVRPAGLGAVDAIEQIGLLDPIQAEQWRARMAEAARPRPAIEIPSALRARVHELLGEAVREARAARALDVARPTRLSALLDALRRLGLLDDADMRWWSDLLHAGEALPPVEPRLERLERSIAGPTGRRRGIRILSIDLFDRGVFVRLQIARNGRADDGLVHPLGDELEPDAPPTSRFGAVRLGDDVGTTYRVLGGGGGSGGGARRSDGPFVSHWLMAFAPHVPARARALVVGVGDSRFEVSL